MSRRARAVLFLALALLAAALAAALADSYGSRVARGYGPLREVVVATRRLSADKPLQSAELADSLESRRVPAPFVPPGTLRDPSEALGLAPAVDLPAGSYLLAGLLALPRRARQSPVAIGARRHPVQISVSGAEALLAVGPARRGTKVDVIVTTEPTAANNGRTYVAAAGVPLLDLTPGAESGPGEIAAATLALTRRQALRLIAAESTARKLTLLPEG